MIQLRNRTPSGEVLPWTLKEILQGKPLGHPSHAMVVHFPVAFYAAVLAFDAMSRVHPDRGLVHAGTFLLIGAFAATGLAALTGLVDWWQMVPGSRKRRVATTHMVVQLAAAAVFVANSALRWPARSDPKAHLAWVSLDVVGVLTVFVGQYLGGRLVYEMGMRVTTGAGRADH